MGLPVCVHVVVRLYQAAVPVSGDDVQLVWVQGVWGEDLLEEVKPRLGLCFSWHVDGGDSEVFGSNLEVQAAELT